MQKRVSINRSKTTLLRPSLRVAVSLKSKADALWVMTPGGA